MGEFVLLPVLVLVAVLPGRELVLRMRNTVGQVEEELLLVVALHEVQSELGKHVVGVVHFPPVRIAMQHHLLAVVPNVLRIVIVGPSLIEEAQPVVEALRIGMSARLRFAQSPLACHGRDVAGALENFRHRNVLCAERHATASASQPLHAPHSEISAHRGVPRVPARHQHTSRRRANRRAGIALRKSHALLGHLIQARCLDRLLPVAAKISVAQIIGHDEDDVGLVLRGLGRGRLLRRRSGWKQADREQDDEELGRLHGWQGGSTSNLSRTSTPGNGKKHGTR